jgi:hypothetical protein
VPDELANDNEVHTVRQRMKARTVMDNRAQTP